MAVAAVEERELLKTISWFDGFVVALANPSFLITGLGASVLGLGGWGAVILWTASVCIGALHNYVYSELAAMFPKLSGRHRHLRPRGVEEVPVVRRPAGGVRLLDRLVGRALGDRHRRRLPDPGPVLHVVGDVRARGTTAATCSAATSRSTSSSRSPSRSSSSSRSGRSTCSACGPAVWVGYVTGGLLLIPLAVIMFLPYFTGDWHSTNLHSTINWHSLTGDNGIKLVIVWLYVMCWSSYGMECCATFAPEYHDTARDTRQGAARWRPIFGVIVYALLPLGAVGTFGDKNVTTLDNYLGSFYATTFHDILGTRHRACDHPALRRDRARHEHGHGGRVAGAVRHLPGRDDHPLAGEAEPLPRAGERDDPGRGPEHRAAVHVRDRTRSGALKILVFSNLGYVLCHVFATSGFLLLRRDRPNWPRPIKVDPPWVAICALLCPVRPDPADLRRGQRRAWRTGPAHGRPSCRRS